MDAASERNEKRVRGRPNNKNGRFGLRSKGSDGTPLRSGTNHGKSSRQRWQSTKYLPTMNSVTFAVTLSDLSARTANTFHSIPFQRPLAKTPKIQTLRPFTLCSRHNLVPESQHHRSMFCNDLQLWFSCFVLLATCDWWIRARVATAVGYPHLASSLSGNACVPSTHSTKRHETGSLSTQHEQTQSKVYPAVDGNTGSEFVLWGSRVVPWLMFTSTHST